MFGFAQLPFLGRRVSYGLLQRISDRYRSEKGLKFMRLLPPDNQARAVRSPSEFSHCNFDRRFMGYILNDGRKGIRLATSEEDPYTLNTRVRIDQQLSVSPSETLPKDVILEVAFADLADLPINQFANLKLLHGGIFDLTEQRVIKWGEAGFALELTMRHKTKLSSQHFDSCDVYILAPGMNTTVFVNQLAVAEGILEHHRESDSSVRLYMTELPYHGLSGIKRRPGERGECFYGESFIKKTSRINFPGGAIEDTNRKPSFSLAGIFYEHFQQLLELIHFENGDSMKSLRVSNFSASSLPLTWALLKHDSLWKSLSHLTLQAPYTGTNGISSWLYRELKSYNQFSRRNPRLNPFANFWTLQTIKMLAEVSFHPLPNIISHQLTPHKLSVPKEIALMAGWRLGSQYIPHKDNLVHTFDCYRGLMRYLKKLKFNGDLAVTLLHGKKDEVSDATKIRRLAQRFQTTGAEVYGSINLPELGHDLARVIPKTIASSLINPQTTCHEFNV